MFRQINRSKPQGQQNGEVIRANGFGIRKVYGVSFERLQVFGGIELSVGKPDITRQLLNGFGPGKKSLEQRGHTERKYHPEGRYDVVGSGGGYEQIFGFRHTIMQGYGVEIDTPTHIRSRNIPASA